jgi:hypothetical protein
MIVIVMPTVGTSRVCEDDANTQKSHTAQFDFVAFSEHHRLCAEFFAVEVCPVTAAIVSNPEYPAASPRLEACSLDIPG